ncbi:MAG: enoyl-CoA hydratase/isomerase family protein [Pseudomonadota bacterium]
MHRLPSTQASFRSFRNPWKQHRRIPECCQCRRKSGILALILSIPIAKEGLMDFRYILLDKKDHIATITLNRPEKLNALNEQMFDEIAKALVTVAGDYEIRVLVLKGLGPLFARAPTSEKKRVKRPFACKTQRRYAVI